jgi:hypothetical protein
MAQDISIIQNLQISKTLCMLCHFCIDCLLLSGSKLLSTASRFRCKYWLRAITRYLSANELFNVFPFGLLRQWSQQSNRTTNAPQTGRVKSIVCHSVFTDRWPHRRQQDAVVTQGRAAPSCVVALVNGTQSAYWSRDRRRRRRRHPGS